MGPDAVKLAYGLAVLSFALTSFALGGEMRHVVGGWRWPASGLLFLLTFGLAIAFPEMVSVVIVANVLGAAASVLLIQGACVLGERPLPQWPWVLVIAGGALNAWLGLVARDFTLRAQVVNVVAMGLYSTLAWQLFHTRVDRERRLMRVAAAFVALVVVSYLGRSVYIAVEQVPANTAYAPATLVGVHATAALAFLALTALLAVVARHRRRDRQGQGRRPTASALVADARLPSVLETLAAEAQVAGLSGRPLSVIVMVSDRHSLEVSWPQIEMAFTAFVPGWGDGGEVVGIVAEDRIAAVLPGWGKREAQQLGQLVEEWLAQRDVTLRVDTLDVDGSDSTRALLERATAIQGHPPERSQEPTTPRH